MLQVQNIVQNKKAYAEALGKRNIKDAIQILEEVIDLDQKRKSTQHTLDSNLAEANFLAKQIGGLMKEGKREEAETIKAQTAMLKTKNKKLSEELSQIENQLKQALYNIPNIPHPSVPLGDTDKDNEEIERIGELPQLAQGSKALGLDQRT